jgi:hypothetical protein
MAALVMRGNGVNSLAVYVLRCLTDLPFPFIILAEVEENEYATSLFLRRKLLAAETEVPLRLERIGST